MEMPVGKPPVEGVNWLGKGRVLYIHAGAISKTLKLLVK
jgi:hypothetical protein